MNVNKLITIKKFNLNMKNKRVGNAASKVSIIFVFNKLYFLKADGVNDFYPHKKHFYHLLFSCKLILVNRHQAKLAIEKFHPQTL